MAANNSNQVDPWPELPYEAFNPTAYLLHRCTQLIGKLKLLTPFEPQWSNVPLWVTSRGLTSGPIPYKEGSFTITLDLIAHQIICTTNSGHSSPFPLMPMSVAELTKNLFDTLASLGIHVEINLKPQEVPDPIPFNQDMQSRPYEFILANAWFRIVSSSYRVMQIYHARFTGKTPPIGVMWGTFDLRDVRCNGESTPAPPNADFITRNAMDVVQIEAGWWHGNQAYPRPAYYQFTYPQPKGIEQTKIQPKAASWNSTMKEFILDYDDVRKAENPDKTLLDFLESTYQVSAELSGWDPKLIGTGKPFKIKS